MGTRSLFGYQYRLNLTNGFPLLTTKKLNVDAVIHDILWMLSGSTNIKYLNANGVHIWDPWADKDGDVGPVYGSQWRRWPDGAGGEIDQISWLLNEIRTNPNSRRLIISAWNVADLSKMAVPPCPTMFQFSVNNGKLSCHLYQRSADAFIGLPFNIAGFALVTEMVAAACGLKSGEFIHSFGDVHLYRNHFQLAEKQLKRSPYELPSLVFSKSFDHLSEIRRDDISVMDYKAHPFIKAHVAV